ncbi:LLM class F420-dependent oxidoreductase [Pseudosporangium ferrugineum]|uniref:Putative F420-dependent oxidoreductase n=1 Tax=Pseudosporangium ferrugineum TaxID=439699 RepID=A0A2T0RF36_9ACTN|nr:LLM class F420-dependent oxidoreductase [Pseudosporangium ferrugineum]PRY19814.1 putative F420-dependent oxidoreductase [Pseudosporangium ferrugineum]
MKADVPARVAVQITNEYGDYAEVRDTVRALEDLGVDIVFNWDHFFPIFGHADGPHLEAWTMLGALAEQTSRVSLGPLVNCTAYRNPDLQADMARTVDHISGGRFIFGTGSGWAARDFEEYGYPYGTPGSRLDALAADLPRIKARWKRLNPAPPRDIPVLVGGGGERKTLRIVAEHADIWHSMSDAATLRRKLGVLEDWCRRVGRNADEIEVGVTVSGPWGVTGHAALDEFHAMGVRIFQGGARGRRDLDGVRRLLRWRDSL